MSGRTPIALEVALGAEIALAKHTSIAGRNSAAGCQTPSSANAVSSKPPVSDRIEPARIMRSAPMRREMRAAVKKPANEAEAGSMKSSP